jgi:hypothetical protein
MSWTRRHRTSVSEGLGRNGPQFRQHQVMLVWGKAVWCVSMLTGIQPRIIQQGGKPQDIAYARMMAMALVREFCPYGDHLVATALNVDRSTVQNAEEKIPAIARSNPSVADVWRDAKRILTLEVQNAANEGLLDAYKPRHRDHPHPAWAGARDHLQPVRPAGVQNAERPDATGDCGQEVQAGRVADWSEADVLKLSGHDETQD